MSCRFFGLILDRISIPRLVQNVENSFGWQPSYDINPR